MMPIPKYGLSERMPRRPMTPEEAEREEFRRQLTVALALAAVWFLILFNVCVRFQIFDL